MTDPSTTSNDDYRTRIAPFKLRTHHSKGKNICVVLLHIKNQGSQDLYKDCKISIAGLNNSHIENVSF